VAVDYLFYGKLIFVAYNFVKFNLLLNIASQYGLNPWHWFASSLLLFSLLLSSSLCDDILYVRISLRYFSQGLPAMLASSLPLFILGALVAWKQRLPLHLLALLLAFVTLFSVVGHKEFRCISIVDDIVL